MRLLLLLLLLLLGVGRWELGAEHQASNARRGMEAFRSVSRVAAKEVSQSVSARDWKRWKEGGGGGEGGGGARRAEGLPSRRLAG